MFSKLEFLEAPVGNVMQLYEEITTSISIATFEMLHNVYRFLETRSHATTAKLRVIVEEV